jgi:formate-dependent nitrite reductase membrane component NrfD
MAKMATRQWMVTHDWMTKPMHQREWIERRGWMVWIAETFTSLGTGLYLVSLFMYGMNNAISWWGMLAGWLIVMFLKLPIHLAYFGKPLRFYRTIPPFSNAWKTSWFARGILFSILFGTFAFVQLAAGQPFIAHYLGAAAAPIFWTFAILAAIFAVGVGIYGGFIMSFVKGIPFWNSGMIPIIFILAGVADGFGLIMGIALGTGGNAAVIATAETWSRAFLVTNALIISVLLMTANYTSAIAKLSVKEILAGKEAFAFWVGIVLLGILIPLVISVSSLFTGEATAMILIAAIVSHTLGAFGLKYCLLKAGIYRPLLPKVGPS